MALGWVAIRTMRAPERVGKIVSWNCSQNFQGIWSPKGWWPSLKLLIADLREICPSRHTCGKNDETYDYTSNYKINKFQGIWQVASIKQKNFSFWVVQRCVIKSTHRMISIFISNLWSWENLYNVDRTDSLVDFFTRLGCRWGWWMHTRGGGSCLFPSTFVSLWLLFSISPVCPLWKPVGLFCE